MAIITNHFKCFLLITNMLIMLSFISTIQRVEARNLLETTTTTTSDDEDEVPQSLVPEFPGIPNLADQLPKFEWPPLPFNLPGFLGSTNQDKQEDHHDQVPIVSKDKPSLTESHSASNP
ncbi:hypothetical protein CsatB_028333 [Cannabis sativa]|uniref:Uncharacterized protein n=1 Tax=Cannabis sativa TaxID=3483 RepID=A0A803PXP5_CANSA